MNDKRITGAGLSASIPAARGGKLGISTLREMVTNLVLLFYVDTGACDAGEHFGKEAFTHWAHGEDQ